MGDLVLQETTVEQKSLRPSQRSESSVDQFRFGLVYGAHFLANLLRSIERYDSLSSQKSELPGKMALHNLLEEWDPVSAVKLDGGPIASLCHRTEYVTLRETARIVGGEEIEANRRLRITQHVGSLDRQEKFKAEAWSPSNLGLDLNEPFHLVLSLDLPGALSDGCFDELLKHQGCEWQSITIRLNVPVFLGRPDLARLVECSDKLKTFLRSAGQKSACRKTVIISSESLRALGQDISFRVAWGRTVADTITRLRNVDACALGFLALADYVIITYYNDGALICPMASLGASGDASAPQENCGSAPTEGGSDHAPVRIAGFQHCRFVGYPYSVEADYSSEYSGVTKGTETLVTASVVHHLAHAVAKADPMMTLQTAVIHGLKASRYFQAHGYVTIHPYAGLLLGRLDELDQLYTDRAGNNEPEKPRMDGKAEALKKIASKSAVNRDCCLYFWNRIQSALFVRSQPVLADKWDSFTKGSSEEWPLAAPPVGDLAEIIAGGYPTNGGFPPVALNRDEGRESNRLETEWVSKCWKDAGWLGAGEIDQREIQADVSTFVEEVFRDSASLTEQDRRWWTFRDLMIKRLASCLRYADPAPIHPPEELEAVVRGLFCECIIRYGSENLNRRRDSTSGAFDIRMIQRLLDYADLFSNGESADQWRRLHSARCQLYKPLEGLDSAKTLGEILGPTFKEESYREIAERRGAGASAVEEYLRKDGWWGKPTSGSILGFLPEFRVGRLYTFDQRDTQSYRGLRQRVANYLKSKKDRPLNIGVFGAPGSGKSFAVKEILTDVLKGHAKPEFLVFNLASFDYSGNAFTEALLEIQNVSLRGRLPIVFWDEFDTSVGPEKLAWLSRFLGPMQDGEFFVQQKVRALPPCVFVFAGSLFHSFGHLSILDRISRGELIPIDCQFALRDGGQPGKAARLPYARASAFVRQAEVGSVSQDEWKHAKGRDFVSRLTGILDVKGIDREESVTIDDESLASLRPEMDSDSGIVMDFLRVIQAQPLPSGQVIEPDTVGQWTNDQRNLAAKHIENARVRGLPLRLDLVDSEFSYFFRRAQAIRSAFVREAPHLVQKNGELAIADEVLYSLLLADRLYHGQRSLESLVRMSTLDGRNVADASVTPTGSQARIHAEAPVFGLLPNARFPVHYPQGPVDDHPKARGTGKGARLRASGRGSRRRYGS